jgi:signal peptidase I
MTEDNREDHTKEEPGFFSFENLRSLGLLIIVLFAFRWSVCSPYHVPTASMEPTIKVGDRLLAWKLSYTVRVPFTDVVLANVSKINRGDIIVFRYPLDTSLDYVKRVIGLPGDKIRMEDDVLYVNDVAQPRAEANNDRSILSDIKDRKDDKILYREKLEGVEHWTINNVPRLRYPGLKNFPATGYYTVPEDAVFVIGDNRDNSQDSREWGKVPLSYVRGKALFVLWSMYTEDDSWTPKFRFNRFFKWLQ